MPLSRRGLLEGIGAGLVTAAVRPSLAEARGATGTVRLHRNENPYGPSSEVLAAIRKATTRTNRFPDAASEALRSAVAAHHGVKADQILLGCGSTDTLRTAAAAFVGSRKKIVTASPTFDWLGGLADRLGAYHDYVEPSADYASFIDRPVADPRVIVTPSVRVLRRRVRDFSLPPQRDRGRLSRSAPTKRADTFGSTIARQSSSTPLSQPGRPHHLRRSEKRNHAHVRRRPPNRSKRGSPREHSCWASSSRDRLPDRSSLSRVSSGNGVRCPT